MFKLTASNCLKAGSNLIASASSFSSLRPTSVISNVAAIATRSFHATSVHLKDTTIQVPKMGDSITEGTLIKLAKQPGEAVAVDEIVAVIETDKVSVDVRAPDAGIFKGFHAKLQDNVKVGSPLFTLDVGATGGTASSSSSAAAPTPPAPSPPTPSAAATPATPVVAVAAAAAAAAAGGGAHHVRQPAIHFRHGQRNAIDQQLGLYSGSSSSSTTASSTTSSSPTSTTVQHIGNYLAEIDSKFPSKTTRTFLDLPPMYGRPAMSNAEMLMIDSGGAYSEVAVPTDKKKPAKK